MNIELLCTVENGMYYISFVFMFADFQLGKEFEGVGQSKFSTQRPHSRHCDPLTYYSCKLAFYWFNFMDTGSSNQSDCLKP